MRIEAACILLTVSLLSMGCFSESTIAKDESPPDDSEVLFYLHDGSYVKSTSGNHHRIENGYQVSGELAKGKVREHFEGIVRDNDIEKVTMERLNVTRTLIGGVFGLFVISLVVGLVVVSPHTGL
jgi:hypothetical protein